MQYETKILNENIGYYAYNPGAGKEFFSAKTGSHKTAKERERDFMKKKKTINKVKYRNNSYRTL